MMEINCRQRPVFGLRLAGSLLAIAWVQSVSPRHSPALPMVVRWYFAGMAVFVAVWGAGLLPLAQVGALALGMVGLVVLSVRAANRSVIDVESAAPRLTAQPRTVSADPMQAS
jgi:hypothetical protein